MRDVTIYFQAGAAVRVLTKVLALALAVGNQPMYALAAYIFADLLDEGMCMVSEMCIEVPHGQEPPE